MLLNRKWIIILPLIVLIVIATFGVFQSRNVHKKYIYVEDNPFFLFNENRTIFDNAAGSIWKHRAYFDWLYDETESRTIRGDFSDDHICGFFSDNYKSYFSSEEWDAYKLCVETIRPYSICYYPSSNWVTGKPCSLPVIEFLYVRKLNDHLFTLYSLFYIQTEDGNIPQEELTNTLEYFHRYDTFPKRVDDHWYYSIVDNYSPIGA